MLCVCVPYQGRRDRVGCNVRRRAKKLHLPLPSKGATIKWREHFSVGSGLYWRILWLRVTPIQVIPRCCDIRCQNNTGTAVIPILQPLGVLVVRASISVYRNGDRDVVQVPVFGVVWKTISVRPRKDLKRVVNTLASGQLRRRWPPRHAHPADHDIDKQRRQQSQCDPIPKPHHTTPSTTKNIPDISRELKFGVQDPIGQHNFCGSCLYTASHTSCITRRYCVKVPTVAKRMRSVPRPWGACMRAWYTGEQKAGVLGGTADTAEKKSRYRAVWLLLYALSETIWVI